MKRAFEPPPGLGPFRIEKPVGRGGMAAVYLAKDIRSGRNVALKLMDPNLSDDAQFIQRFEQEALACEGLKHPNIVDVYAHGETGGWHFLAAEFVDGGTIAQLIGQVGALPPQVVLELAAQALSGLAYAHGRGIVHRDLKPENLLLTTQGALKIGDFGIARSADQAHLTRTGMLMGTAEYMSPEQAKGQEVDGRSDLFSVGSNLYEMLTTENPFHADNPAASLLKIMTHQYVPLCLAAPSVPPWLEQFVDRLLAAEPEQRFASARDAYAALEPQIAERRRLNPTFLLEFLRKPNEVKAQLDALASTQLTTEARALVDAADPLMRNQAVVKAQLALAIDPTNREARFHLDKLKRTMPVTLGPSSNPKVLDLERAVAEQPNSTALAQQLALAYRAEGSLLKAAAMMRRYLSLKPGDALVANSLQQLTGEKVTVQAQGPLTNRIPRGSTGGPKVASNPALASAPRASNGALGPVRNSGSQLAAVKSNGGLSPPTPRPSVPSSGSMKAAQRPRNAPSLSVTAAGSDEGSGSTAVLWMVVLVLLFACAGVAWTLAGRPSLRTLVAPQAAQPAP